LENLKRGYHFGDVGIDWRIILKLSLKKYRVSVWNAFNWLRIMSSAEDSCEHNNEFSG
jgi:hypothetical protein